MNYAMIQDGVVINVIVWDGVSPYTLSEEVELVPLDSLPEGVWVGWALVDGVWTAPVSS
jgi:hypothetical protein